MQFSLSIPTCREGLSLELPFATPEDVVRISQRAEELGYHSVWGNDHITPPAYVREDYDTPPQWFEPLITLAYIAAKTKHIRLGTAILALPLRDPVWVAKQVATLDTFSGGRMMLAVGVGAYREEFILSKPRQSNAHRGNMLTEGMQVLNTIFNNRISTFKGEYYAFDELEIYPKPIQNPFPLFSGGNSENELVRCAQYGTGWMGASLPPDKLSKSVKKLSQLGYDAGRDPAKFEIAPQYVVAMGRTEAEAIERFKKSRMYTHLQTLKSSTLKDEDFNNVVDSNLIGTPAMIIDRVGALIDAGVTLFGSLSFLSPNVADMLEHIQFFAEDVIPAFAGQAQ
jgi:probable F420-dependent oxidoreductase